MKKIILGLIAIITINNISAQNNESLSVEYYIQSAKEKYSKDDIEGAIVDFSEALKIELNNYDVLCYRGQIYREIGRYKLSIQDLNKAVELNKNDSWAFSQRAKTYEELNEIESAIEDYTFAISLDSENSYIFYRSIGDLKHKAGFYKEAIVNYNKAIGLNSNYAYAYVSRGRSKAYLKDYQGGLQDCNKGLSIDSEMAWGYFQRAEIKYHTKDYVGAIVDDMKAIEIYPNYDDAYLNKALSKIELKDYYGAKLDIDKVVELNGSAYSYKKQGDINSYLKKYDKAITSYNKAVEIYPDYSEAYVAKGLALEQLNNNEEAFENYNIAIEKEPDYAYAYVCRGDISKPVPAVEDYSKAIEISPNYSYAYNARAYNYRLLKEYDKAISDYEKVMEQSQEYKEFNLKKIADIEFERGNYKKAVKYYLEVIDINPKALDSYFKLARSKDQLGDDEGAIKIYESLLKYEKEENQNKIFLWGTVYNNIGYSYLELGNFKKAEQYIEKAVKLEPGEVYIWGSLAELYYNKGEYEKCFEAADKSVKIYEKGTSKSQSDEPGFGYYLRAMSSISLNKNIEQVLLDLSKAGELGYSKAYDEIKKINSNKE
jgi:tetratricopeptide (TPR) repeat protein